MQITFLTYLPFQMIRKLLFSEYIKKDSIRDEVSILNDFPPCIHPNDAALDETIIYIDAAWSESITCLAGLAKIKRINSSCEWRS